MTSNTYMHDCTQSSLSPILLRVLEPIQRPGETLVAAIPDFVLDDIVHDRNATVVAVLCAIVFVVELRMHNLRAEQ